MGSNVKYLNFAIIQSVDNIFTQLLHAGTKIMKHIKRDFRSKTLVRSPGWTYGDVSKAQNSTSSEHGHVAYHIKRNHKCSNMVGYVLPLDPPPPANTGGLNVKFQLFQYITMLNIF